MNRVSIYISLLLSIITLSILVVLGITQPLDDYLLLILKIPDEYIAPLTFISDILGTYMWPIICVPLFLSRKLEYIVIGCLVLINFAAAIIIKLVLSFMVPRIRPPGYSSPVIGGNSYPSGHTMRPFACAIPISLRIHKLSYLLYPLAILSGFLRLLLQVHYFTDVLAGALIGILLGLFTYEMLFGKLMVFFKKYAANQTYGNNSSHAFVKLLNNKNLFYGATNIK
ncbi:MAG: phosphatase PAP2 family protein [Candidatus Odinarchaeia archaeon]